MTERTCVPFFALLLFAACSSAPEPAFTQAQLFDPKTCQSCHVQHYSEWLSSRHAKASDDPVFLAMNRRGQRETGGALGPFCVNCHAPMAVRTGATSDGLNLATVDPALKGVTCFFCHSVDEVQGAHDDPLHLAEDGVMRGPFSDPIASTPHGAAYSALHDRDRIESATLCGACHDVVTSHGADIERTFAEWKGSAFSKAPAGTTCSQCHMDQSLALEPIANVQGAPKRRSHSHAFPAVDFDLEAPDAGGQLALIQQFLDSTVQSAICVRTPPGGAPKAEVILDNVASGHGFPSGSAQDRRFWVELHAYADGGELYASGNDGSSDAWLMRDCMFGVDGGQVSMFWDAASHSGNALPAQPTFDSADPRYYETHLAQTYPLGGGNLSAAPDRITVALHLQPIGRDVLDDLVASGDLDPSFAASAPELTVGEPLEWTPESATTTFVDPQTSAVVSCVTHTGLNVQAATVPAQAQCTP